MPNTECQSDQNQQFPMQLGLESTRGPCTPGIKIASLVEANLEPDVQVYFVYGLGNAVSNLMVAPIRPTRRPAGVRESLAEL